jgi:6-pyruvoyltetrahydropterin/6-carboxytetrahydropterin synthase
VKLNLISQMQKILITRVEHFNAAHKLYNPKWTEQENMERFGKCANANYHGHNYELHVTVKGEVDLDTGYAINAKTLSDIMKEYVVDIADHRNLNLDVPFMKDKMPSSENFAIAIWQQLEAPLKNIQAHLYCVKLIETRNIYVEYYGE